MSKDLGIETPMNSFIYNTADSIALSVLQNPQDYKLPDIISSSVITGGVVHYVWELMTKKGKYYLKIRGNRFSKIRDIKTCPGNIIYEYKAISILNSLMPENFPDVIFTKPDDGILIITDVIRGGNSLEELFYTRKVNSDILKNLGQTLNKVHHYSHSISTSIRDNNDKDFYDEKLRHKLGYLNNPILNKAIDEITYVNRPS